MIINYDMIYSIGTYETFEAISRQISMEYHGDFLYMKYSAVIDNNCFYVKNYKINI